MIVLGALNYFTHSWLISLALLGGGWLAVTSFNVMQNRGAFRIFTRGQRAARLRRMLDANPHDRRARLQLAEIEVEQGRFAAAVERLRSNVAAGDDDPATLFLLAQACGGAQLREEAEELFAEVEGRAVNHGMGAVFLERGRRRLQWGDLAGAQADFEMLLRKRVGSIEGRVLLARTLERLGNAEAASAMEGEAWKAFKEAPRFQQRRDRLWAWRARPLVPASYAAGALAVGVVFAFVW
jgi:predicted Zn-dependent protease